MSSLRSTSILFTLLTLPLLLQAIPVSQPALVLRNSPVSTDLNADADATVCRINNVDIVDPTLVLDQLERGDTSNLETIGVDIRDCDLVASLRDLLQQCASDPFKAVLPPLSSGASQAAALVNSLSTGSDNIPKPDVNRNTPQSDVPDTNIGKQDGDSDVSGEADSDEFSDVPAEAEDDADIADDDTREDGSVEEDGPDDAGADVDTQDDNLDEGTSRTTESNASDDASDESQDMDEAPEDNDESNAAAGTQPSSVEDSAPADNSAPEDSPSNAYKQGEDCSFQGDDSSQFEDRLCVSSHVGK